MVELENEAEATTFGPGSRATYLNDVLLPQGELLVHYYATGHFSLDNYISQVSGQAPNYATGFDCSFPNSNFVDVAPGTPAADQSQFPGQVVGTGCVYPRSVETIANQLDQLYPPDSRTDVAQWREYAEDMGNNPSRDGGVSDPMGGQDCAHPAIGAPNNTNNAAPASGTTPADQYATRHTPFAWFHSIIDDQRLCDANVVPLGSVALGAPSRFDGHDLADTFSGHLAQDLRKESTTPMFSWISPNLCNDGHDTNCAGPNTAGQTGTNAGGLHGADTFLQHWIPLIEASPAYRSGHMLVIVTFDEGGTAAFTDGSSCCNEQPGPSDATPGFDPWAAPIFTQYGLGIPTDQSGGGLVGALMLDPKYIQPGSVDTSGYYNHYSALRSFEDLLGITRGGVDGYGHLGFAAAQDLTPFGIDVFNRKPEAGGSR